MAENTHILTRRVIAMCRDMGFALAGVCAARPSDRAREMREWLASGVQGSMTWLGDHLEERLDVRRLVPGARSIIMVGDVYAQGNGASGAAIDGAPAHGRVARYAQGLDYHQIIKKRLHALSDRLREEHPGALFRTMVDIMPFNEREHALRAGLGWVGKHTLLIHPRVGSWFSLGGVVTSLELPPPPPSEQSVIADACGTCTRCIDACPTRAITPYRVDASRCISYLTVERRALIDPALHASMGEWIFGCDVCQEVCPHNREREEPAAINPAYTPRNASFDLLGVLGWSASDRSAALSGTALKRATALMWKRNALIVAGNALSKRADPALLARVRAIAEDTNEDELVRTTARDVLARLAGVQLDWPSPPPSGLR